MVLALLADPGTAMSCCRMRIMPLYNAGPSMQCIDSAVRLPHNLAHLLDRQCEGERVQCPHLAVM